MDPNKWSVTELLKISGSAVFFLWILVILVRRVSRLGRARYYWIACLFVVVIAAVGFISFGVHKSF